MISEKMKNLGQKRSIIREIFSSQKIRFLSESFSLCSSDLTRQGIILNCEFVVIKFIIRIF